MTIRDAVLLADGLQEGASLNDAEVARLPENRAAGVTAVTQLVVLDSTYLFERRADGRLLGPPGVAGLPSLAPEITLQPYDAVLIKRQPEWQLQQTVIVTGEVKFPGDYSLTNKTQRLSDIIAHAGGLTTSAYPDGIVFVRKHGGVGRIGVDLSAVLRDPRDVDNLALFDGDSIYIPRYAPRAGTDRHGREIGRDHFLAGLGILQLSEDPLALVEHVVHVIDTRADRADDIHQQPILILARHQLAANGLDLKRSSPGNGISTPKTNNNADAASSKLVGNTHH